MKIEFWFCSMYETGDPDIQGASIAFDSLAYIPSVGTIVCFGEMESLSFPVEEIRYFPHQNLVSIQLSLENYTHVGSEEVGLDDETRVLFVRDVKELASKGWKVQGMRQMDPNWKDPKEPKSKSSRKRHLQVVERQPPSAE